jgi:hypothetical protein
MTACSPAGKISTPKIQKRDAFVQIGFVGVLVAFDLHQPVELIDIRGVNAIAQPIVFRLMALDRRRPSRP